MRMMIAAIAAASAVGTVSAFGQAGPQRLYLMDLDDGEARPLTDAAAFADGGPHTAIGSPEFSPDGRTVVFDAWRPGLGEGTADAHVFAAPADGSGEPVELGDGCLPSVSPDGQTIAFSRYGRDRGAWLMDADGRNRRPIAPGGWSVQWSPVKNEVAYTLGREFVIRDLTTGRERRVAGGGTGTLYWNFDWSPDGERIAYFRATDDGRRELCVVSAAGHDGPPRPLYRGHFNGVAWHPDGETIYLAMRNPDYGRTQVYALPAAGGEPALWDRQDPRCDNSMLEITRDGKTAVFSRQGASPADPDRPFRLAP